MNGIYLAAFKLQGDTRIPISTLDSPELGPGLYVYVGSGQKGVEHRIRRHFSEVENTHWHVDYLSAEAEPVGAVALELPGVYECVIARATDGEAVEGFGCSDCRCDSHLFKLAEET